ncbi:hypothetical protein MHTCC0001_09750 [Flavobacteriaceae bacterium MHTCC 0001]
MTTYKFFLVVFILALAFSGCTTQENEPSNDPVTQTPSPEDKDGDGVNDTNDDCPNEVGPASNNGCPETNAGGNDDNNNDGDGDNDNNNDDGSQPSADAPTNGVLVNIAIGRSGERGYVDPGSPVPFPLNGHPSADPLVTYADIIDNRDVITFFIANRNNDGSFPTQKKDQPDAFSNFELRNNQTISGVLTMANDPKANMVVTIEQSLVVQPKGTDFHGNYTHEIKSITATIEPYNGKTDALIYPKTEFEGGAIEGLRDYGNLSITPKKTGMKYQEILDTFKVGKIYMVTFQGTADADNDAPGNDGESKLITIEPEIE